MSTALPVIVSVIGQVCLLVGLWLRLRWRTRHEQVQRQHIAAVTQSIAADGRVEIVEHRPDGHHVRIEIVRGRGGHR